jgi:hypothetical protein
VLDLERAHALQEDVERDTKKFVADNDIWVGFVERIFRKLSIRARSGLVSRSAH